MSELSTKSNPSAGCLLVVDGQRDRRASTAMLLEAEGYSVLQAATGDEALRMLTTLHVEVMLTALEMKPMDGLTLLKKAREAWPHLQVILITARGSIESAVEAMRLGASDYYITEPFEADALRFRVERARERLLLLRSVSEMNRSSKGPLLVVDDQRNMCASTAMLLEGEGYEVFQAATGQEALDVLVHREVHLLLADLRMEPMDGLTLLQKALAVSPHLRVLIMTAYGSIDSAVEAMRLGAFDYFTKPFKNGELGFRVDRAWEHHLSSLPQPSRQRGPFKGAILVVDDQRDTHATTAACLEAEGHDVLQAATGEEALKVLSEKRVQLMLVDLKMEPMDGLTLLRKALVVSPHLRVIMMTPYSSIDSAVEAQRLGASDYITRPFKNGELLDRVNRALALSQ